MGTCVLISGSLRR
ncbi:hypothetical protein LINPERHAP1_LOCUS21636 [Linum perenne]